MPHLPVADRPAETVTVRADILGAAPLMRPAEPACAAPKAPAKAAWRPLAVTAVTDVRAVPLDQLSASAGRAVRRVAPAAQTEAPPVAAFESAL